MNKDQQEHEWNIPGIVVIAAIIGIVMVIGSMAECEAKVRASAAAVEIEKIRAGKGVEAGK